MGSITLYQKKARGQKSGWPASWTTISGTDYISYDNNAHVVYSAKVDMTGNSALNGASIATNFVCNSSSGSHAATLKCYVYNSDPTGTSASTPTSPPPGYIGCSADISATVPYYGLFQTFNITFTTQVTTNCTLYFWFTDDNDSNYADYLYSTKTGNEYTFDPTVSGAGYWVAATKTLSISPERVTTGGKLTISIANADASMTALFKYGETTLATATITNGSGSVTCPKSWFNTAGIYYEKEFNIAVEISGTTLADDFDLLAGSDCNPEVTSLTATIVQPSSIATDFPNTYIANVSKVKLAAEITLNTDSAFDSVVFSYPGGTDFNGTYNSSTGKYEATMPTAITVDTVFTATVKDKRELTGTNTVSVTGVVPYTTPTVSVSTAYRCDSTGAAVSGGQYYRIMIAATCYQSGALSTNTFTKLACKVKGTAAETTLTNNTLSSAINGNFDSKLRYTIVVIVKDKIGDAIEREISLEGISRFFVIKRDSNGATHIGIGTSPTKTDGVSTIELPTNAVIYIGGVPIGSSGTLTQAQADWSETDITSVTYILNKPTIPQNAEDTNNKKDTITGTGSSTEYTSTKCVYDLVGDIESILEELL